MKLLITGAKGFVGKNLTARLAAHCDGRARIQGLPDDVTVTEYDLDTPYEVLEAACRDCDFVFHLAGINRPKDTKEFMEGNGGFTDAVLSLLEKANNPAPVLLCSSIQAVLDNPYGISKREAERLVFGHAEAVGGKALIYRLPNVFGKWCRPNYNSAVATFCHNIAHDLPITVNDPTVQMRLVYIDDVVDEFLRAAAGTAAPAEEAGYCKIPIEHRVLLGDIADTLYRFRDSRKTLAVPQVSNAFEKALYSTYLSYLPEDGFAYPLTKHADARGSFTEILRTDAHGQFSVNVSRPGIVKGNHYHNTKVEKFLVVSGRGIIRFRRIGSEEVLCYEVSGDNPVVVDIPAGYTHNIENLGDTDMVTFMWCNECFDPNRPDTYFEEV